MTYDEECPANLVEIKSRENKWIFLFIKIRLGAGLNCSAASEEIKIKYSDLSLQRWATFAQETIAERWRKHTN